MVINKIIVILILGLVLLFHTNCNDDNPSSSSNQLIANWNLIKITFESESLNYTITAEELDFTMTLKFKSDNTYQVYENGEITEEGTWSLSGNKITFRTSDYTQVVEFVINNNKLILTYTEEEENPPVGPPTPPSKLLEFQNQGTITMEFSKVS